MNVLQQARLARSAGFRLATVPTALKDQALLKVAGNLDRQREEILRENQRDLAAARACQDQFGDVLVKRLALSAEKIDQMVQSVREVVRLEDPVGKVIVRRELDDSLTLTKHTVPIGVIGVIFESRPDALVQIASLCLKSGNVVILKGGSEARHSNQILFKLIKEAVEGTDPLFKDCLHLMETRADIRELLKLDRLVDLMIPRGSSQLVRTIMENTKIPVLGHAEGVCHLYIDREADPEIGLAIAFDAKCQYPAVCNAIETLLVHQEIAPIFLPRLVERLKGVELRGDRRTRGIIQVAEATEADWQAEYNDLILAVKVVDSQEQAIEHINTYGSHHTDGIVTANPGTAEIFLEGVDSSSVMWNCSTRFADGFRYGLGAEVGIATGKIHARGPVGLEGLTSTKFKLIGWGQVVDDYVRGERRFTHRELTPGR